MYILCIVCVCLYELSGYISSTANLQVILKLEETQLPEASHLIQYHIKLVY